jgi:hypothetical protein
LLGFQQATSQRFTKVKNFMYSPQQLAKAQGIIFALLQCATQQEAAASLGMSAATLRRWLDKPEFQELYLQARLDRYWFLKARVQHTVSAAVQTILEIMADATHGPAAQFQACRSVLLSSNNFRFQAGQIRAESAEQIQSEESQWDDPSSFPEEAPSFSGEIKGTARKAGAEAAKINRMVLAMIQHRGNRAKAAVECDMSPVTIWRWMKRPEFQEQYRKELRAEYFRTKLLLQHTADMAFSIIERIMRDRKTPGLLRVRIAQFIFDFADRAVEEDHSEWTQGLIDARQGLKEAA